jgi:hypothetical protein
MNDTTTQRLVEMTFASAEEVAAWLTRLGLETDQPEEGVVRIHNPHLNITTAFTQMSDPITRAVCLGFALAGAWWPQLFRDLPPAVNREWRRRRAQARKEDPPPKGAIRRRPAPASPPFAELPRKQKPR